MNKIIVFLAVAIMVFSTLPHINSNADHINKMDGYNWSIETVDYKGKVGRYTAIALDHNDYPHISYCNIGDYDLTDCNDIEEALNEVNNTLDEANDALPDIEEQLNYWRAHYDEADRQARSLQGSSNQEGYATITFVEAYWWVPYSCTATASPCVSGCTLSCGGHTITVSSGFSSYEEMAERYYYYYLITSGFTMDVRARDYFWMNETEYRWFDNPYGRGWYGETGGSWGFWTENFRYHPGYLDWVARKNYAQGERDKFQEAYDDTVDAINKLNEQKAMLEEAYSENGC